VLYSTQKYWVSELCPSSIVLNTGKHNVSETGTISVLRWEGGDTLLGSLEKANLNHWTRSQLQFPVHCTFYYLEFRMIDKVQKPSNSEQNLFWLSKTPNIHLFTQWTTFSLMLDHSLGSELQVYNNRACIPADWFEIRSTQCIPLHKNGISIEYIQCYQICIHLENYRFLLCTTTLLCSTCHQPTISIPNLYWHSKIFVDEANFMHFKISVRNITMPLISKTM
jgi:hypothetical protein